LTHLSGTAEKLSASEFAWPVGLQRVHAARVPCAIFLAEAISADSSVTVFGMIDVVVVFEATWLQALTAFSATFSCTALAAGLLQALFGICRNAAQLARLDVPEDSRRTGTAGDQRGSGAHAGLQGAAAGVWNAHMGVLV